MTIRDFIKRHDLRFTCKPTEPGTATYHCTLGYGLRSMTFVHESQTPPTLERVLEDLATEVWECYCSRSFNGQHASKDRESFANWCAIYGHDLDEASRQRYLTIRRRTSKLKYVLSPAVYEELLTIAAR